ncbi:tyrosine-type recombinase/integrase [Vibrio harveyi]|uniref:tyrosine-type recombinase/integrase n=2 Tax=Vibrio harveyi TaxID=669 RepID=UPI003BB7989C
MTTQTFITTNRFNTFYFRQKTPKDILHALPCAKKEIRFSLNTKTRQKALIQARQHKVMLDLLFSQIRDSVNRIERMRETIEELDESTQRELMLKQRAVEAINDQQFTQQLFFLLERKNRIKDTFAHIKALQGYSLSDIDLSSVDKINRFIAIIDLLSSSTLSDPAPYISQLSFKKTAIKNLDDDPHHKAVNIARMVVKRNKPKPAPETPNQVAKQAKQSRQATGDALVEMLQSEIDTGTTPAIRTNDQDPKQDIVLEGISLDNEQDTHNFVKLLSLIEQGEDVQLKDFEAFSKPVIVPKSMLKVSELFAKFYDENKAEWKSHKTHSTNLSFYNTFVDIVGDKFVDELDYPDANHYIDILRKLPANRNKLKAFKDKSIEDLLAMEGTFEPMKTANVNKNIERIKSVFLWAVQRKLMQTNILMDMKVKAKNQKVQARNQRLQLDNDDLNALFNSPEYRSGTHARTYQHWLPLLGLYTGARLSELAQLRIQDVYTENGVWLIDFNESEDKSLKTINSVRKVPVHKTLVRLGFIKYLQYLKKAHKNGWIHSDMLLPDVVKGRDGYGHNTGKWFDRHLTKLQIKQNGKSFHSLRHTFADHRKQADENPAMTAELLGHEIDNETMGRYGKDYRITLKKTAIDRYQPLTEAQIKKISKWKLWKEFKPRKASFIDAMIDENKSIYKDKNLHKALAPILGIEPPEIVPRKQ